MSEELFDITFSGQIVDGADIETVKQKIALMFKADEARIAQMFSGHRVVIKRQLNEATAAKYRGAFHKAGAICEVRAVNQVTEPATPPLQSETPEPDRPEPTATSPAPAAPPPPTSEYVSKYPESDEIPQALLTEPLGISGDQIEEIAADIAPPGSRLLDHAQDIPEPQIDISALDVAPVGSDLYTGPEKEDPPPPDTTGLSMAD